MKLARRLADIPGFGIDRVAAAAGADPGILRLENLDTDLAPPAAAIEATRGVFRWNITPYYASLMDPDDPACPVRRQVVPTMAELAPDLVGVVEEHIADDEAVAPDHQHRLAVDPELGEQRVDALGPGDLQFAPRVAEQDAHGSIIATCRRGAGQRGG